MTQLSQNQQSILDILLSGKDPLTADDLVDKIGITKTAVKSHLDYLLNLGLLAFKDEPGVVGRPKRKYYLTESANEAFPKQYSWLSIQLLELLSSTMEPKELTLFMRNLANKVYENHKSNFENFDSSRRLRNLEQLMNALGYKAKIKTDKPQESVIEAFNCIYHNVAKSHPELCEFDRQLISNSTKMKTTLESCIAKGGKSCRFCLKK